MRRTEGGGFRLPVAPHYALLVLSLLYFSPVLAQKGTPACYALEYKLPPTGFQYRIAITRLPPSCDPAGINITRVFQRGACIGDRRNDLGSKSQDCTAKSGSVERADGATCRAVFANAPKDTFVTLSKSNVNQVFDTGTICNPGSTAYVFVQTTCAEFRSAQTNFAQMTGRGVCKSGNRASTGVIAGSAIASAIMFAVVVIVLLLCCRMMAAKARPPQQQVGMQPMPPYPPGQGYGGDAYGQAPYGNNYPPQYGAQPGAGYPPQYGQQYGPGGEVPGQPYGGMGMHPYPNQQAAEQPGQGQNPGQGTPGQPGMPPILTATVGGGNAPPQTSAEKPSYMQGGPPPSTDGKPPPGYPTV